MDVQVVEQKLVSFGASELLAVKTTAGKLFAAVKWVCKGIGLTDDQAKRQVKNIQSDLVVSRSVSNLTLNTNAGLREVLCIELDFLPLWLAKISITPSMQESNPEAVENLVNYQLKAKDALAAAFLPKSDMDPVELALTTALENHKRLQTVESDVTYLKDNMRIDRYEQKQISDLGKARVVRALGGNKSAAYRDKSLRSKTFSAMWRELKDKFDITSYEALAKVEFANAMNFLAMWEPNTSLRMDIQTVNE